MMARLSGKRALVTGGSRGIGRAIVAAFVEEGASVLTCGRGGRPDDLPAIVDWATADVSQASDVTRLLAAAREHDGAIHIVVNNAGIQIEKTVTETSDDDWNSLMGVNAKGVFHVCRSFIPVIAQSGGGTIINIGSISGNVADPGMALYNASKAFVHGLTRSIAIDHGKDGVRCNAICPGWIMTEMADAAFDLATDPAAAKRDALARHAAGRFGLPEDIARSAVWLASDDAAFVTGQTFTVDGGLTAASPLQPGLF
ncbi:MAG: SDR family NAD(P)-dependent oxidoreductase [Hyphomicrobiaceae bacterium]